MLDMFSVLIWAMVMGYICMQKFTEQYAQSCTLFDCKLHLDKKIFLKKEKERKKKMQIQDQGQYLKVLKFFTFH